MPAGKTASRQSTKTTPGPYPFKFHASSSSLYIFLYYQILTITELSVGRIMTAQIAYNYGDLI
jgi:hypothetical protein